MPLYYFEKDFLPTFEEHSKIQNISLYKQYFVAAAVWEIQATACVMMQVDIPV